MGWRFATGAASVVVPGTTPAPTATGVDGGGHYSQWRTWEDAYEASNRA
jgi:hypothetical protein